MARFRLISNKDGRDGQGYASRLLNSYNIVDSNGGMAGRIDATIDPRFPRANCTLWVGSISTEGKHHKISSQYLKDVRGFIATL